MSCENRQRCPKKLRHPLHIAVAGISRTSGCCLGPSLEVWSQTMPQLDLIHYSPRCSKSCVELCFPRSSADLLVAFDDPDTSNDFVEVYNRQVDTVVNATTSTLPSSTVFRRSYGRRSQRLCRRCSTESLPRLHLVSPNRSCQMSEDRARAAQSLPKQPHLFQR